MDITALSGLQTGTLGTLGSATSTSTLAASTGTQADLFGSMLQSAVANIQETNAYIDDANTEQIKLAMGETDNTHDLTIALQKAETALQYTIAVRDKVLEAYNQIMNMQI